MMKLVATALLVVKRRKKRVNGAMEDAIKAE